MSRVLNDSQINTLRWLAKKQNKPYTKKEIDSLRSVKFETFTIVDKHGLPWTLTEEGTLKSEYASLRESLEDKECIHDVQ